jgi:hypothetical protein
MPLVAAVGVGKGGRGGHYKPEYLRAFVDKVNSAGMFGILGHQRDADLDHHFPLPVVHWLVAKWDADAAAVDQDGKPTGDNSSHAVSVAGLAAAAAAAGAVVGFAAGAEVGAAAGAVVGGVTSARGIVDKAAGDVKRWLLCAPTSIRSPASTACRCLSSRRAKQWCARARR